MSKRVAVGATAAGLAVAGVIAVAAVAPGSTPAGFGPRGAHASSMAEGAATMQAAADAMLRHAESMRASDQRSGDAVLLAHARHWADDAAQVAQRSAWMAADPASRDALLTEPRTLAAGGNLAAVTRGATAMVHSLDRLRRARTVDLEALRWSAAYMSDEGRLMVEHARTMASDIDQMAAHHGLAGSEAAELRAAAQALAAAGEHTMQAGGSMADYVTRTQRALGRR